MVQYREQLMPLVQMAGVEVQAQGSQPILVFADDGRSMGLVVDEIIDIVEESVSAQRHGQAPGILGSALVSGRVTDLLNVREVIEGASPAFFSGVE
jgi:two-component system chemotaxis sensor kinase CheA